MSQTNNRQQAQLSEKEHQAIQEEFNKLSPNEQKALLAEIEKELKAETAAEAAPLLEFVLKHIRAIIALVVVLVIFIAIWGFWQWNNEEKLNEAEAQLIKISDMSNPEEKIKQLQDFKASAPEELQLSAELKIAQAAIEANNLALAEESLSLLTKEEKYSPLGLALHFSLTNTYARDNKAEKVLEVYEEMLANAPENVRTVVLEEAAFAAENLGNKEKALAFYMELLEINKPENKSAEPYYKARIQELSK